MEDPILNKEASSFAELLGISQERALELDSDIDVVVKPGFTILAKVSAIYLNRAKTFQEQLFLMTLLQYNITEFSTASGIDVTIPVEHEFKFRSFMVDEDDLEDDLEED